MENQEIESDSADILSEEEKRRRTKKINKIIAISSLILLILAGLAFYLHNRISGSSISGIRVVKTDTAGGIIPQGGDSDVKPDEGKKGGGGGPVDDLGVNGRGLLRIAVLRNLGTATLPCIGDSCSKSETSCTGYYDIDLKDGMGIFFALNKDTPFGCSDEVQIKPYAEAYLSQNITKNILVEGYACDLGEEDYNMELSKRRAEYVKKALVSAGIPENRIKIKWYGSTMFRKAGFGPKEYYRRAQISLR